MKVLSMVEFQKTCNEMSPSVFCFSTSNQKEPNESRIKIKNVYHKMLSMLKPNRICLLNDSENCMWFNKVKCVNYYDEDTETEHMFEIVCENKNLKDGIESYFVVAENINNNVNLY